MESEELNSSRSYFTAAAEEKSGEAFAVFPQFFSIQIGRCACGQKHTYEYMSRYGKELEGLHIKSYFFSSGPTWTLKTIVK